MGETKSKSVWYLSKDCPQGLMFALQGEAERGQVLIASAFLDLGIEWCIRLKAKKEGAESIAKSLLGRNQPLGSFGARIDTARAFGLINTQEYRALDSIRKIRNDCAHKGFKIKLNNKTLVDHIRSISAYIDFHCVRDNLPIGKENPWLELFRIRKISFESPSHQTFLLGSLLLHSRIGEIITVFTGKEWGAS
jgi:DNA-binding MltR family transcriptional regulator